MLERVTGPEMQQALESGAISVDDAAAQLAELHHRLHELAGPSFLRQYGAGDRLLHRDLHLRNVLLGPSGPW